MKRGAALVLGLLFVTGGARADDGPGHVVAGFDSALLLPPAGAPVEPYRNDGYEVDFRAGGIEVRVDLRPLRSTAPFEAPRRVGRDEVERLALALVRDSTTQFAAAREILGWVHDEIRYDLDRSAPQDAASVLRRRSAYCAGLARLTVTMLTAVGIEAREVPGYVFDEAPDRGGMGSGFHRWVEVFYPDRGWVFSDPLVAQNFVPANYLRLASEQLEDSPIVGRLIERRRTIEDIDLAPGVPAGVSARANGEARTAAALVVRLRSGDRAEATLVGQGIDRTLPIVRGSARFLGLPLGRYDLRVRVQRELAAWKALTFREPVLAELVIPLRAPSGTAGGD